MSKSISARNAPRPTSYAEAEALLGTRDARTIGYNTFLERDDLSPADTIHVRLHRTRIVSFYAYTDSVRVNTGGWETITTRERMNRYLPAGFHTYNEKRVMYMGLPDGTRAEFQDGYLCIPSAGARFTSAASA